MISTHLITVSSGYVFFLDAALPVTYRPELMPLDLWYTDAGAIIPN
jgi:hypothetical protein